MDGAIKKGSVVRVDQLAPLPEDQLRFRGRLGKVAEDSERGTLVLLEFFEEKLEQFHPDVLRLVLDRDDPNWDWKRSRALTLKITNASSKMVAHRNQILRKKFQDPRTPEIKEFAKANPHLTSKQVAEALGVPWSLVGNIFFREGLGRKAKKLSKDVEEKILEALQEAQKRGETYGPQSRIAREFGATPTVVERISRNNGIFFRGLLTKFIRDIQSILPSLSDADLLRLLSENGMLPRINLGRKGGIAEVLRALRNGEPVTLDREEFDDAVQETDYETPESRLDLHAADKAKAKDAGEETIRHIVESQLAILRAKWFRDGEAASTLIPLCQTGGGEFFKEISNKFLTEVAAVESLETPWWKLHKDGLPVEPSPMQKYVAWRLTKDRVLGNWSGTGAGKTDSAGLASYVIGAEFTFILAVSSTVPGWKEQLEETFPGCQVYTNYKDARKAKRGLGVFLVMNYEKFQGKGCRIVLDAVTALNPDFIVLDEIQMVKQRSGDTYSRRSIAIRDMISRLPRARILGMSATPVINELQEGISLLEAMNQKVDNLRSRPTIPNALDLFAAMRQVGVRYLPKYEQTEETMKVVTQRDDLMSALQGADNILPIERTLLPAKLEVIKDRIKPGTVIYLEYVEGMVDKVRSFVESLSYSVGEYIGDNDSEEREATKQRFIAREIDVLIGSRAVSVGVDGLQQRCDQLILLSLPWTHAAYMQIVGRVYRQGGKTNVKILIPQVIVGNNGGRWSWDEARLKHIESKRTLAECVADGVIPTTSTLSRNVLAVRAIEALNKMSKKAQA